MRLIFLSLLFIFVVLIALSAGPTGWQWPWMDLVLELRAPRVVLALLIGGSLALAGVAMQALLQNELADPYVLGLSGGASAGAVASLALWPGLPPGPAAALGAAGAAMLVRGIARGPFDSTRLLLGGIAVGSVLSSVTGLIVTLAPSFYLLRSTTFWLFGGVGTPQWTTLIVPSVVLLISAFTMLRQAERFDRLTLGDDLAVSLGVELTSFRRYILLSSVLLTACAVAAGGLVGFVGLIAPHAARRMVGATHRRMIPVAGVCGALLVLAADTVARTAFAPKEVPLGLLTAAVGGPFFLWLLRRGVRR